ncbi:ABC transporter ATP-binding protein/permease [Brachybacterium sp. JHP9]|uniref:ABC transporter ATP-binding protein/permease n=1 Tax=Brachybacterium equifaecis TaxID=2910770 RepID=A0ABT0QWC9_9MICO|nr:ABC transporter ATP-binding protein [Brachybacterium equifaecis]MCL6421964.1 ABC transporter ATP-binding protein/permease [Brachybacterium equifaecis]
MSTQTTAPAAGRTIYGIDWERSTEDVLGEDATALRQLDEHAQILPVATVGASFAHVARRLLDLWPMTLATLLVVTGGAAAAAWMPRLIGGAVVIVEHHGSAADVWRQGGMIVLAGALQAVLSALGWALVSSLGQRILAGMREEVIDRALDLPVQTMEITGIGDALSRVADDVDITARAVNNVVPNLIQMGFYVLMTLIGMATLSPWLLILLVVVVPMYAAAAVWYLRRTAPIYRRERVAMGARAQGLLSAIQGIPTVHAYGIERRETRHVSVLSEVAVVLGMRVMVLVTRMVKILAIPENISIALVLVLGYAMVHVGGASIGTVTAASLYLISLIWPMMNLIFSLDDVQSAAASLTRMVGVIESIDPAASPGDEIPADGSISLRGVSHAYGAAEDAKGTGAAPERIILQPIDLEVAPGETIALVGASGAGKSTLASILAGTLTPRYGQVLHGGADLARADLEAVRRHSSIVSQDVHVFRGTLAEDLRLARPEASEDELWGALERVDAASWVRRLPKALEIEVGEKGERLTAEQSQQLALARVVLQDPAILVLDEATADEGSSGARVLERAALEVAAGRTTVIVAHRLSQASTADRILVMADGRVVEEGPHAELVARGGVYAGLWSAWSGESS